jgi:HAD superfamily hydrolase (TIGR01509 family)
VTRIRAVLFDLGGTLVDEKDYAGWVEIARRCLLDVDAESLAHAFVEVEREFDAEAPRVDGGTREARFWQATLARALDHPIPLDQAAHFLAVVRSTDDQPYPLYSDARRCLDRLRAEHRRLGVISNSTSEARVRSILDHAGIVDYFERVVSSGTEGVAKPDPAIFLRAVERLGVPPEEAFYVGNLANVDARAARAAGLHSVWLNREGTGLGTDPPEITSLLEVPLCVRLLETGATL